MRVILRSALVLGLLLIGGFFVFAAMMPRDGAFDLDEARARMGDIPRSEIGIVVFTGGGGQRIERALRLYEQAVADRVLISGTHPRVRKEDLRDTGVWNTIECCVDLGPRAKTTIGNAREASDWADQRGYRGIYLVTSEFHLPRAIVEMRGRSGDLTVIGVPVASNYLPQDWYASPSALKLLGLEYLKFLVASVRNAF
jgi:uncharacterized SAM-binding protein YcdF (DUF218 family)